MNTTVFRSLISSFILALGVSLAGEASASEFKPSVKMKGKIFGSWGMDLSEGADSFNEFAINRAYLTALGQLSEEFMARVTTDVGYVKGSDDTKLRVYLKYAYLEWKDALPGVKLRIGAAGTGLVGLHDKFMGRRWIEKSYTDRVKLLSSSDYGIHALGKHMDGMLSYQVSIMNGEGYGKVETDKAKAIQTRVTVDPLAGGSSGMKLPISGFVSYDVGAEDTNMVAAGVLGFGFDYGKAWAEYVMAKEGDLSASGFMVTLVPEFGDVASGYLRFDSLDPNSDVEDDEVTKLYAGVTRDFHKKLSAGLIYERETAKTLNDAGELVDQVGQGIFARLYVGF